MYKLVTALLLFILTVCIRAQDLISPCPGLFVYEGQSTEPNKWYGIVTLLSDVDLIGIWLRLSFDQPSLQLGNWFGEVVPRSENDYVVKNKEFILKAHTPKTVRFFIEYDSTKPVPKLTSFRLNARNVCPGGSTEFTTEQTSLFTSGVSVTTTKSETSTVASGNDKTFSTISSVIKQPNSECGVVAVLPQPLITSGQLAREGEFPWHAALYRSTGATLTYICGGSLITKSHLITAGHCVMMGTRILNPDELAIYLGKYILKAFSGLTIQDPSVSQIILNPDYDKRTYKNDLAVIKFVEPVIITTYVKPICLWEDSDDLSTIIEKEGVVAGWGFDESGKLAQKLMKAKMPVVAHDTCIFSYPDFFSRFSSTLTYCAGFKNGTSVCNGDSGGGMIFPKSTASPNKVIWQLRGVVSISVSEQNTFRCDTSHYVVFTDIAKYLDWIKQSIST